MLHKKYILRVLYSATEILKVIKAVVYIFSKNLVLYKIVSVIVNVKSRHLPFYSS